MVLFDPSIAKIVGRNGERLPAQAAAKAGDTLDEHTMAIERGERGTGVGRLSAAERELVGDDADAATKARQDKSRFPRGEGWAPLNLRAASRNENGELELAYEPIRYNFHINKSTGKPLKGAAKAQRVTRLANKLRDEVRDIQARAASGDRNAQVILRQSGWYRNMRERLRDEFGGLGDVFADFLGGASPNTPVKTNWNFAVDALRGFTRGRFDRQVQALGKHLESGGKITNFDDPILQETGKLYGMNSRNLMLGMLDMWRNLEPGQAPKARNFSGNLIGFADQATIDVWAARTLRRLNGDPRIPPPAEIAVQGNLKKDLTPGGEFGFGQDVFRQASKELDMAPDDLQAVVWFMEKERWGKNGWTTKSGEGGSFEQMADKEGLGRYQAGLSIQQGDQVPSDAAMMAAQRDLDNVLTNEEGVVGYKALSTIGRYAGTDERAFDVEVVAKKDWSPEPLVREVVKQAQANDQYDAFVSRVLQDGDDLSNARPGVEVYFRYKKDASEIEPLLAEMNEMGVDGFTFSVDYRAAGRQAEGAMGDNLVGVRVQYVPEIAMRWDEGLRARLKADPGAMEQILEEVSDKMYDIVDRISTRDNVTLAKRYMYDTIVLGKENYDEYLQGDARASRSGTAPGRGKARLGQPLSENVAAAIERLEGGAQVGRGDVPGRGASGQGLIPDDGGAR
jgi:hypothetical protein